MLDAQQRAIEEAIHEAIIDDTDFCTEYLFNLRATMECKLIAGANIKFLRNLYGAAVTCFCLQSQMREVAVDTIRAVAERLYKRHEGAIEQEMELLQSHFAS